MNQHHEIKITVRRSGLALGLIGAALLAGCATQPDILSMQDASGQQQNLAVPKSTWTDTASGEQADALAKEIVTANNNDMKKFDQVDGRLDKLQTAENTELQKTQQALDKLEAMSEQQGTGQITLFFKTGSAHIDQFQNQRLVSFLDYVSRTSRGRAVILLSIGSASATGTPQVNKKLSQERSEAPLPIIDQYLVNVPHKFYKVTGIGDLYAPKKATQQVEDRYQSVRIIAVYDTAAIPKTP